LLALAVIGGCSQFKSSKRLDLSPFAEDMIAVAGDIQYGLGQQQIVYLNEYFEDTPETEDVIVIAAKLRRIIRGAIAYAIQIVTLADSRLSGPERAQALADYLDGLLRPVLEAPGPELLMSVAELDTVIADVRSRSDLLGALEAAQPIIDEVARASGDLFDEAKSTMDSYVWTIRERVEAEYAPVVLANKKLRDAQIQTAFNIELLGRYRRGEKAALDSLVSAEPSLAAEVEGGQITEQRLRAVEERLLFKLRALAEVREQLQPDIEMQLAKRRELGEINASANAALRQGRVAILAWARAHDRLARGVVDPAQIDVLGIARKAAGSVAPL
jgi:hypothetical protein